MPDESARPTIVSTRTARCDTAKSHAAKTQNSPASKAQSTPAANAGAPQAIKAQSSCLAKAQARLGAACAFARCRHRNAASKSQVALRGACCSRAWVTVSVSSRSARTLASLRLAGPWAAGLADVACVRGLLAAARSPPASVGPASRSARTRPAARSGNQMSSARSRQQHQVCRETGVNHVVDHTPSGAPFSRSEFARSDRWVYGLRRRRHVEIAAAVGTSSRPPRVHDVARGLLLCESR